MKVLFLVVGFVLAAFACVDGLPFGNDPEYAMIPDGDGNFKLVNINEDPEPENFFDAPSDVNFILFTRTNPNQGQALRLGDDASVTGSNFNVANPTRFIIHGWNNNGGSAVNIQIRNEYLALGDFNVIVVDWGVGAQTPNYLAARNRVGAVGGVTSQLIQLINRVTGAHPRDMTVVGHSLGAHAAGFAGKNLLGDMRLGNVVALDAALPLFNIESPGARVSVDDALYVESIHTNGGLLGFDLPLGHANFYPNWGRSQPGCGVDVTGNCAHGRAVEFFAESITSERNFWSRQCASYDDILAQVCTASGIDRKMGGEPVDTLARGVYFLTTNRDAPFATGIL